MMATAGENMGKKISSEPNILGDKSFLLSCFNHLLIQSFAKQFLLLNIKKLDQLFLHSGGSVVSQRKKKEKKRNTLFLTDFIELEEA